MEFLPVLCFLAFALYFIKPTIKSKEMMSIALLVFNLAFVILLLNPAALLFLGGFLLISFASIHIRNIYKSAPFFLPLIVIVLSFAVFKNYTFLPLGEWHQKIPEIIGLSYIVFRTINLLFDKFEQKEVIGLTAFLNYTLSIFTILSGPVQRYKDFQHDYESLHQRYPSELEMRGILNRLVNGILKVLLIAPVIQSLQNFSFAAPDKATLVHILGDFCLPLGYLGASFFYLVFLYMNFSGYTDIVIALGRLVGFNLPENFRSPFQSLNFLDFWNRWHISLSSWFKDYCNTPVLKKIMKTGAKNMALVPLPGFFISFGLLGLWHGRTWPFIFCGLMLAMGAVLNHLFKVGMKKSVLSGYYSSASKTLIYGAVSSALTFLYIAIAITGLWLSGTEMMGLLKNVTALSFLISVLFTWFLLAGGLFTLRGLYKFQAIGPTFDRLFYLVRDMDSTVIIGTKFFLVMCVFFVFSSNIPDFVYQGF